MADVNGGRLFLAAMLAALVAAAVGAATCSAVAVTVGPDLQGVTPTEYFECAPCQSFTATTLATAGGTQTTVPADGTVTSWAALGKAQEATAALFDLRPRSDGSLTFGAMSVPSSTLDGFPIATSLQVLAGDRLALSLARTVEFEKSKVSVGLLDLAGAAWSELAGYQPGLVSTPSPVPGAELLYNATVELLAPAVGSVSPAAGGAGATVTIRGVHLAVATSVTFGGVPTASFSGDDGQITAVAPAHTPGAVDVQVTTAGGTSPTTPGDAFTYASPAPPPDLTAPTIASLLISPSSFRAANLGGSVVAAKVGAHIAYRLSEPATVTFTVQRMLRGRRQGHSCVALSRRHRGGRRCTRLKPVAGSFARTSPAGPDLFLFSGRVGGRALPPGRYRLAAVAVDAARNRSKAYTQTFEIVR